MKTQKEETTEDRRQIGGREDQFEAAEEEHPEWMEYEEEILAAMKASLEADQEKDVE